MSAPVHPCDEGGGLRPLALARAQYSVDRSYTGCADAGTLDACCVRLGYAQACASTGRLHVDRCEARAFDVCRFQIEVAHTRGGHAVQCWPALGAAAYADARAICSADGGEWCVYVEELRQERASDATLAVSAVLLGACVIALRRRWHAGRAP